MDTIIFLQENDPDPDGRLRAAYNGNDLIDPATGSLRIADNSVGIGNLSWIGIALTRYYYTLQQKGLLQPGDEKYLEAAKRIANWILANCEQNDIYGGFSLGLDAAGKPFVPEARSTEHNIDVFVFGGNLFYLTAETKWYDMAVHAREFVKNMYHETGGKYWLGAKQENGSIVINYWPVSADAQSWSALAQIDEEGHLAAAVQWMMDNLLVCEDIDGRTYCGIKFTNGGEHIQCEITAGAAMALLRMGRLEDANELLDDLCYIIAYASPDDDGIEDGIGIVATPHSDGAPTGFTNAVYPHLLHTASSAWTGMAFMAAQGNSFANPLEMIPNPADLDMDAYVNLVDVSRLAEHWLDSDCGYPDWCFYCDMDHSSTVDMTDLALFSEFWLKSQP